jgi:hypothetical protein
MRLKTGTALGLLLVLGLTGCGGRDGDDGVATAGGTATAGSSPTAEKDGYEAMLDHVKCMREQGVDMPDPERDGEAINMRVPEGTSKEKVEAATEKCRQYLPNGGVPEKADPEQLERARQASQCIREHGFPNFPDPDENGGIRIDGDEGFDPTDPELKKAEKACGMGGPKKRTSIESGR